jgi:hypothetical protein
MLLRRSLYYAQFALAIIAPVWVLVSRGIIADGLRTSLLLYVILTPVLTVALAAITGVIVARKSVRVPKAVSWLDAAVLIGVWLSLFVYGLFGVPLLAVVVVLVMIVGFWAVVWELFVETRTRIKGLFDLGPVSNPNLIVVPPERLSR